MAEFHVGVASEDPTYKDWFEILQYTADAGNAWFRGLYAYGVWLPADYVSKLLPLAWGLTETWLIVPFATTPVKEGYAALARLARTMRLKLFRVKPKLHMHDHVTYLRCTFNMARAHARCPEAVPGDGCCRRRSVDPESLLCPGAES